MKSESGKSKKDNKQSPPAESCYYEWIADAEKKVFKAWIKKA